MPPWTPPQVDAVAQYLLATCNHPHVLPWAEQGEAIRNFYRTKARRVENLVREAGP